MLPITAYRSIIAEAVAGNALTIITAETGAGKSTQVPQYLLEEGYRVVVTQPRRLAARGVASRVAEELGEAVGGKVGYRTAEDRKDSPATRCLFVTDGLALVRELMGCGGSRTVLVLDEVHEWNLNLEMLVGWVKRELAQGAEFKVVLMSATIEADKLSAFFDGAPVVEVPGRLFPVEARRPAASLVADVAALVKQGRNVLVFQPGKAEIEQTIAALRLAQVNAEILPLHGGLDKAEQDKCFRHYPRPKVVVATNVAQTSITINDIDAVVDSGLEKRTEVVDGVEGLYMRPISRADSEQRKGRAGRTKSGVYIDHCPTPDRLDFPKPEIQRVRLDMAVLRLKIAGVDMEELDLFHQPSREAIREAKRSLIALGCIDAHGEPTEVGRQVAKLPLSANIGRMVVEAIKRGVVEDVVAIAGILEEGGIVDRKSQAWKFLTGDERESDLLAQLAVFKAAKDMRGQDFRDNGVFGRSFFRVQDIIRNIKTNALRNVDTRSTGRREDILKAVCAGMVDHLYQHNGFGNLENGGSVRAMAKESVVVLTNDDKWIVGVPFDIEISARRGKMNLGLVTLASKVSLQWLMEVAPQLVREEQGIDPRYNWNTDSVVSTTRGFFNGNLVKEETVDDGENPKAVDVFASWVAGQMV